MKAGFHGGDKLRAKLEELKKKAGNDETLRMGFLEGPSYPDGMPVATVAAINEYGNPAHNQPPRPFFRQMLTEHASEWGEKMAKLLKANGGDVHGTLELMGQSLRAELQESIRDLVDPPNAPATAAQKGFDKPLIDTGHMLNSVDYEIKKGGA